MLFIVEHGSEKQAFLLCRKIDKCLHQADNDLQTTTSELKRVTLSFATGVVYSQEFTINMMVIT
jgi:hypothetical protein